MGEGQTNAFDKVIGGNLANACMAMEIYRKGSKYGSLVFGHAAGISSAIDFLERTQSGLFTNVDEDNLRYAQLALGITEPSCSAGCLDILLDKYIDVLKKMQADEKSDPQVFSDAKALLYKLACRMTDLPSIYPGMVKPD